MFSRQSEESRYNIMYQLIYTTQDQQQQQQQQHI